MLLLVGLQQSPPLAFADERERAALRVVVLEVPVEGLLKIVEIRYQRECINGTCATFE